MHSPTPPIPPTPPKPQGLFVVGRSFGLKVVAFVEGVSKHSLGHGSLLLKKLMMSSKMAAARDALPGVTQGSKCIHAGDFQFQVIQAPPVQPVLLRDITPSVNKWRTGLNNRPAGLDLKTMSQLQAESDIKLVRLPQRDNIGSVVARRSMRDGDVVCTLGGLAYDSVENVHAFMNSNPSGRELVGGLVRIDGVQHEALGDEGSAPQALGDFSPTAPKFAPIYFVMAGIGRYVRHYAQVGAKQANTVLSCNLGAGAGDSLVQLVVKTRNRSGIAAGSPVLFNFGMDYDHAVVSRVFAEEASQPQRIRTMPDTYFKHLGEREAQEAAAASGEGAVVAIDSASAAIPDPALDTPIPVPVPGGVVPEPPTPTPTQTSMPPAPNAARPHADHRPTARPDCHRARRVQAVARRGRSRGYVATFRGQVGLQRWLIPWRGRLYPPRRCCPAPKEQESSVEHGHDCICCRCGRSRHGPHVEVHQDEGRPGVSIRRAGQDVVRFLGGDGFHLNLQAQGMEGGQFADDR